MTNSWQNVGKFVSLSFPFFFLLVKITTTSGIISLTFQYLALFRSSGQPSDAYAVMNGIVNTYLFLTVKAVFKRYYLFSFVKCAPLAHYSLCLSNHIFSSSSLLFILLCFPLCAFAVFQLIPTFVIGSFTS